MKELLKVVLAAVVTFGVAFALKLVVGPSIFHLSPGGAVGKQLTAPEEGSPPIGKCDRQRNKPDGCFIWVPGGSLLMGAQAHEPAAPGYDSKAQPDEGPPRAVKLAGFWLQGREVIAHSYQGCVNDGTCTPSAASQAFAVVPREGGALPHIPAHSVSWSEAATYCAWLGGRLPTEAEWEYAARGAAGNRFPWGNRVQCAERSESETIGGEGKRDAWGKPSETRMSQVAEDAWESVDCSHSDLPEGRWGRGQPDSELEHMAGSMWEWVADYYSEDYYERGPDTNPQGPESGSKRVQRGGGWMSDLVWDFRAAGRASLDPELRLPDVGFRCAWSKPIE